MGETTFEPIRQPRRLWLRMLYLIGASYLLDTVLLGLFSMSGALAGWVPLAYAAAGFAWCAVFYALLASGLSERFIDGNLTVAKLVSGAALQLAFIVLAPAAALYFVCVLFVVFAFASLRLPLRQALIVWGGVALALAVILARTPAAFHLIHDTPLQRVLVGVSIVSTLARCTLLGLYNTFLRTQLARLHAHDRVSLDETARRGLDMAAALHEDLGQELAGVALLLSASAGRLERDGHPGAPQVSEAVAHLRAAIVKTRVLAAEARAVPHGGALAGRRG